MIELHTVANPNDYIKSDVTLHLQIATQDSDMPRMLQPCLKRTTCINTKINHSVVTKARRCVTFQDTVEIREFEKYLEVSNDDATSSDSSSSSSSDTESEIEYENTTTNQK